MRISRFLRRTYNICRGIVGIHEYSRITLTFVRLICSSILSNGKKRKMASNRNRRDGRRERERGIPLIGRESGAVSRVESVA